MSDLALELFSWFFVPCLFIVFTVFSSFGRLAMPRHTRIKSLLAYQFPDEVWAVFRKENPQLPDEQCQLAFKGLKEYFILQLLEQSAGRNKSLGMPSVLVDQAWHAFMLFSVKYEDFCLKYFGKMIHHHPDPSARPGRLDYRSRFKPDVVNTWSSYCRGRDQYPDYFTELSGMPLLFKLDDYADYAEGWRWTPSALRALDRAAAANKPHQLSVGQTSRAGLGSDCISSLDDRPSSVYALLAQRNRDASFGGRDDVSHSHSKAGGHGPHCSGDSPGHSHCHSDGGSSCGSSCGGGGD